ncbi:hypothetical protein DVA67_030480 [Solirubrobacter sp. CPCC 204708]|nr:hypothetical protein [Solirubrobacter deserti]
MFGQRAVQERSERAGEDLREVVGVLVHERAADHRIAAPRVAELACQVDGRPAGRTRGRGGWIRSEPARVRAGAFERALVSHPATDAVLGCDGLRGRVADDDHVPVGQLGEARDVARQTGGVRALAGRGHDELLGLAGDEDRPDLRVVVQPRHDVGVPLRAALIERRPGARGRRREHAQRHRGVLHSPVASPGDDRERRAHVLRMAVADQRDGRAWVGRAECARRELLGDLVGTAREVGIEEGLIGGGRDQSGQPGVQAATFGVA